MEITLIDTQRWSERDKRFVPDKIMTAGQAREIIKQASDDGRARCNPSLTRKQAKEVALRMLPEDDDVLLNVLKTKHIMREFVPNWRKYYRR